MADYGKSCSNFKATAVNSGLSWCSKHPDGWYRTENVEDCKANAPKQCIGGKMWPTGYFAVIEFTDHDVMRDFGVDEACTRPVDGPFATEGEALAAAEAKLEEVEAAIRAAYAA